MRHFEDVSFGQVGAAYVSGAAAVAPSVDDQVVVAITCIAETSFTTLTPEDRDTCYGTINSLGDDVPTDATFPAGVTIYGRFSNVVLTGGTVIVYYAH